MAKFVKWGKEQDSSCTCGAPAESAAHVMLRCPTFSNAITAAHDSFLNSIRQALRDQCPHFTQHWCGTAGSLFPGLTAEFPTLATHLNGPRFVNLERQVPDAIFVQDDGAFLYKTTVIVIELARTDNLVKGYWRDQRAAKDEQYRPLREAIAAATGATVAQAILVIGFRGGLYESEWRAHWTSPHRHSRNFDAAQFGVQSRQPARNHLANPQPWANWRWLQERSRARAHLLHLTHPRRLSPFRRLLLSQHRSLPSGTQVIALPYNLVCRFYWPVQPHKRKH